MKGRQYYLILFLLVFIGQSLVGQTQTSENNSAVQNIGESENHLDNTFYIKVGLGPKNQFADLTEFPFENLNDFANNFDYDFGAESWLNAEIGSLFYFGSETNMYRFGLDVTYINVNYIPTDWSNPPLPAGATNFFSESDPVLFGKTEIGPVFSINPTGFWVFDAFYQIGPTFGNPPGGFLEFEVEDFFVEQELISEAENTIEYLGLSHSAGVSVRIPYAVLSLTAMFGEFEYDNLNYFYYASGTTDFFDDQVQITSPLKLKGVTVSAGLHF